MKTERTTFWCSHPRGWYFRILGYGLSFTKDTYVPFSVRNGYRKVLYLFGGRLMFLTRGDMGI